jgi:hypothetical protein
MRELRFQTSLYSVGAVDAAVEAFAPFAEIVRESGEQVEIVRIEAREGHDEVLLVGEFGNYVLGVTVDGGGQA